MDTPARPALTSPRSAHGTVRRYADTLRELVERVLEDPLDEARSAELVAHIVNHRPGAAALYRDLDAATLGIRC